MKTSLLLFKLSAAILLATIIQTQTFAQETKDQKGLGNWSGKLDLPGIEIEMIFKISISDEGQLSAKLDVPVQGARDLPVKEVFLTSDSMILMVDLIKGNFKGEFKNNTEVIGNWNQRGTDFPLTLKKTDKITTLKRPQTPQKPFPYNEEEMVYENKKAGIKLAGTLTLPENSKNVPAVILISGSGAQDRDETIFEHKPFLVLADYLTSRGIAVLRVDDRGVGGSEGNIRNVTSEDFAEDVLAGIEVLKSVSEIDKSKIGLIGHSEGGLIAPIAANLSSDIDFIVLMAGPGIVGEQILYKQGELINRAAGLTEEQINQNKKLQSDIFEIMLNEKDSTTAFNKLRNAYSRDTYTTLNKSQKMAIDDRIKAVNTTWFKYFLSYDPYPALTNVSCPVLGLIGEKDLQVPAKINLEAIEKALTEGGNKNFKVLELKNLNHLFQNCETGSVAEYGQIEETISPDALEVIFNWIQEVVK